MKYLAKCTLLIFLGATLGFAQQDVINKLNSVFVNASEKTTPSVVTVHVEKIVKRRGFDLYDYFGFRNPRKRRSDGEKQIQAGAGSGVIVSKDGYILTNNHVVGDADKVTVTLTDRREYKAEIIGKDPLTDLALIKIDNVNNLKAMELGTSKNLSVGEHVLAIGNPLSIGTTVTTGIISALNRNIDIMKNNRAVETFIQTDAAINPGNSGGALVNLSGQLIGINTAIASGTGYYAGYGFAVPVDIVKYVMNQLKEHGKVRRGYIGIALDAVDYKIAKNRGWEYPKGVYVSGVLEEGSGYEAGLKQDDIILRVDGVEVNTPQSLQSEVSSKNHDAKIEIVLHRSGKKLTKMVQLREPDSENLVSNSSKASNSAKIGITVQNLSKANTTEFDHGVEISNVLRFSEAHREGLNKGDIILKVGRTKVNNTREFYSLLDEYESGDSVRLYVAPSDGKYKAYVYIEIP